MTARPRNVRLNRRVFVQGAAATGAAIAAAPLFAPTVRAAKTLKLGYVSPQTGPLAAFAEADRFVISSFLEAVKGGIKAGNASYPVDVVVRDHEPGFDPMRDRGSALHFHGCTLATVFHRPSR